MSAPFVGNPIPDVVWSKDDKIIEPSERIMITCDGRKVFIEVIFLYDLM